jgi:disulfide bond formation protein DsbB
VIFSLNRLAIIAVFAALAALGVAYFAQFQMALVPCPLCLLERWPYRAIIGLGLLAFLLPQLGARPLLWLIVLVLLAEAALAFIHVGVEFHWWASPLPECNGILIPGAPLPMTPSKPCDQATFLLPGLPLSMAAMNLLYALVFAAGLAISILHNGRHAA